MNNIIIRNAQIVNEGQIFNGDLWIENDRIKKIEANISCPAKCIEIDAKGMYILPGCIDDQVHFREPGLTHKGDISSESKAAVAGGVTTFMEMPNTVPNVLTQKLLQDKYNIAEQHSLANYSFFMGVSNNNLEEVLKTNPKNVCGVKIFMGSSTGNMLVDDTRVLEQLFKNVPLLIATHCEDEQTIKKNLQQAINQYGENIPVSEHAHIRSRESCYLSSSFAVQLAKKYNTRLHVLHLSTAEECALFENKVELTKKRITSEVCVHHLFFSSDDYQNKGNLIKWNPSIKEKSDQKELWNALIDGRIDVVASDHAPHTLSEKSNSYLNCPSGGPLVQHTLLAMLEKHREGLLSIQQVVEKMAHNPSLCFQVKDRGFLREGYFADLVLINPQKKTKVTKNSLHYKCAWSPFESSVFSHSVFATFVNGVMVYKEGEFCEVPAAKRLEFDR
ncbi:MAG: dihydroorotase [Flavobacteriia bacterium]|nr:dihydroorotase [Flavobacteriia bacterium]